MQDQPPTRACDSCQIEPAAWRHPTTGAWLCVACGLYAAGRDEGEIAAAREQLADAVIALSGLGVEAREVLDLVRGELAGRAVRLGPERDQTDDVRLWASRLEIIDA